MAGTTVSSPRGPAIAEPEWRALEAELAGTTGTYLVASGSLPRGVPDDFFARVARTARDRGIRFVLDSSGRGLAGGLAGGGVFLAKPSISELEALVGRRLESAHAIADAARAIVTRGEAEHVAVTMGEAGAMLVDAVGVLARPAIPVAVASAVGAGDSFLAGMIHALCSGRSMAEAFDFGMAAGAAAVMTEGTGLARPEDIHLLADRARTPASR